MGMGVLKGSKGVNVTGLDGVAVSALKPVGKAEP